jgi:hypothetical protein
LADWATRSQEWGQNLLTLGDFNIDRAGDPLFQAFTSTGLTPPAELNGVPRTIFDVPASDEGGHFYDQIAWFTDDGGVPALTLHYTGAAGGFDFVPHLMTTLSRNELAGLSAPAMLCQRIGLDTLVAQSVSVSGPASLLECS